MFLEKYRYHQIKNTIKNSLNQGYDLEYIKEYLVGRNIIKIETFNNSNEPPKN